jgi:ribosomal protein S13
MTTSGAAKKVASAADLQQLKGIGKTLAKRLYEAGFDSFEKIAQAGEEGLKKVGGISPRAVGSIVEQARQLAETQPAGQEQREVTLNAKLAGVREQVQNLAQSARERFQDQLNGKSGKKLSSDLVRLEDALGRIGDGGKKRFKRSGKALVKAEKRVSGLDEASLKKIRKGLKRARKAVLKVL